jgi:uncharacterized protein with PIN domain
VASPPEARDPTFFLDRSLGRNAVADLLRGAGAVVELHDDHFPTDCGDDEWIAKVTARDWIVLTKDRRIRNRGGHLDALRRAGAIAFILTSADTTGAENARALVQALDRMRRIAAKYARPVIATVSLSGHVTVVEG